MVKTHPLMYWLTKRGCVRNHARLSKIVWIDTYAKPATHLEIPPVDWNSRNAEARAELNVRALVG